MIIQICQARRGANNDTSMLVRWACLVPIYVRHNLREFRPQESDTLHRLILTLSRLREGVLLCCYCPHLKNCVCSKGMRWVQLAF